MLASNTPRTTWDIVLPDEDATQRFAVDVAAALKPGDLVTLSGDLGAGKTTLARAIIRALAADNAIEVPSPTFTLLQTYDLPRFPVVHADLYRVNTLAELAELGWEEASEGAAVLVEWPDRAAFEAFQNDPDHHDLHPLRRNGTRSYLWWAYERLADLHPLLKR